MPECVICNKELSKGSFNVKDKYELTKGGFICKECANKIGIKGLFSASLYTTEKARKKYCEMYPDEAHRFSTVSPEDETALDEQFIKKISLICFVNEDSFLSIIDVFESKARDTVQDRNGREAYSYSARYGVDGFQRH